MTTFLTRQSRNEIIGFHPETPSPLTIIIPTLALPEAVKKFPKSPPPCPSPVKREGISFLFQQVYPLPRGERVG